MTKKKVINWQDVYDEIEMDCFDEWLQNESESLEMAGADSDLFHEKLQEYLNTRRELVSHMKKQFHDNDIECNIYL